MTAQTVESIPVPKASPKGLFWKEWIILTLAAFLSWLTILPTEWSLIVQMVQKNHQNLYPFLAGQSFISFLELGAVVAVGLFAARRIHLGVPLIEGWLKSENVGSRLKSSLLVCIPAGILGALLVTGVDWLAFRPLLPGFSTLITQVGGWQGLLASFYGAIFEEIETRLLVLSLAAWLLGLLFHTTNRHPSKIAMWGAMAISAAVFAFGHLPLTSQSAALIPLVVVRSFVLNGSLGLLYGYLYWKRGLEGAIMAHFSSDLVVHFFLHLI